MKYALTIMELLKRPIIRNDKSFEWENKMTDEELKQFDKEVDINSLESGDEIGVGGTARYIDREILYNIFKLEENDIKKNYKK